MDLFKHIDPDKKLAVVGKKKFGRSEAVRALGTPEATRLLERIDFEQGSEGLILSSGAVGLVDLLDALLNYSGPAEVDVATWRFHEFDAGCILKWLVSGRITDVRWVLDPSILSRQREACEFVHKYFGDARVRTVSSHAKWLCIRNDKWDIVVLSSANLNKCIRIESFFIRENAKWAAVFVEIVDEIYDRQPPEEALTSKTSGVHIYRDMRLEALRKESGVSRHLTSMDAELDRQEKTASTGVRRWL